MRLIVKLSQVAALGVVLVAGAETTTAASVEKTVVNVVDRQQSADSQLVAGRQQGFFSRVMELERRKNAWLRGLFR